MRPPTTSMAGTGVPLGTISRVPEWTMHRCMPLQTEAEGCRTGGTHTGATVHFPRELLPQTIGLMWCSTRVPNKPRGVHGVPVNHCLPGYSFTFCRHSAQ